jgi:hypothetical protein
MGCRLIREETIYFVRNAGNGPEAEWYRDEIDRRLLPPVYIQQDGRARRAQFPSVVPIEIRTFEGS